MTIHGWGSPIYLSQLSDEFGNYGAPYYLSQYYAGGGKVPAGAVGYPSGGGAVGIPSGGYITLNNFYGAAAFLQQLTVGVANNGFGGYGYDTGHGTVSPPTFSATGGQGIQQLVWLPFGLNGGSSGVQFMLAGMVNNTAVWGALNINGTILTRTSAYFYQNSPTWTSWSWNGVGNIFGTSGNIPVTVMP